MRVLFCRPQLTMKRTDQADLFFKSCREILDEYVTDIFYLSSEYSCAGVPLFRRNGYRQSSGRKPLIRNRDTTLN